jgi:hypothetical protein
MCPGDPLGDHGQRAIVLPVIFEPVLANEDDMGVSAPPPHQARAGLQHAAGVERTSALLELSRQNPSWRCNARLGPPWERCRFVARINSRAQSAAPQRHFT